MRCAEICSRAKPLRRQVLHTPGHTPGSVCFEVHDPDAGRLLFAGDTLFRRSIGRSDLPGGDGRQLARSIQERLYTRDLDAVVIPGHKPKQFGSATFGVPCALLIGTRHGGTDRKTSLNEALREFGVPV